MLHGSTCCIRTVTCTYRHTLNAEHAVDAVRPAAITAPPHRLAVADHDIVLLLLFALPVRENVVPDELPHGRDAPPALALLLDALLQFGREKR